MLEDFQGALDIVLRLDMQQVHFGGGVAAAEQLNVDRARRRLLLRRQEMRHGKLQSASAQDSRERARQRAREQRHDKNRERWVGVEKWKLNR
jgi:hypothetical protein